MKNKRRVGLAGVLMLVTMAFSSATFAAAGGNGKGGANNDASAVCKNGGWTTAANGPFKNQGDCVSYYVQH